MIIVLNILFVFSSILYATQVTFLVDMSDQAVVSGDANYPAVYVSGGNLNGPSGLEMSEIDDNIWILTTDINPGTYTYKFRNGYYDYWDGPGWEQDDGLIQGGCAYGQYHDRQIIVGNEVLTVGPFCFNSCDESCGDEVINYEMVWSDEFSEPEINLDKWNFEIGTGNWGWGNNEAQYYTSDSENAYINEGKLVIQAVNENYGGMNYTSARMTTKNKGDWKYGKLEIRAKLPSGTGTWPAIWMLPSDGVYGGWPGSGEIDIMEHVGYNPFHVHGTIHTESNNGMDGTQIGGHIEMNDVFSNFHNYTIEWNEQSIKWYVDDTQFFTYYNDNQNNSETWPFNQDFHLLINLAIGGNWAGQQGIDDSIFPVNLEIDYVRVYETVELSTKDNLAPKVFKIKGAYPNPFNPSTKIEYLIPYKGNVKINVYNIKGQLVKELLNKYQLPGVQTIKWNSMNDQGELVGAGIYFFTVNFLNKRETQKVLLLQ
jgi:beta-glucanase (GH16 family)